MDRRSPIDSHSEWYNTLVFLFCFLLILVYMCLSILTCFMYIYVIFSSRDVLAAAESRPKVRHGADERGDQRGVLCRGPPGHRVVQHQPAHEWGQLAGLPGNCLL